MRLGRPEILVPGLRNEAGSRVVPRGRCACVQETARRRRFPDTPAGFGGTFPPKKRRLSWIRRCGSSA